MAFYRHSLTYYLFKKNRKWINFQIKDVCHGAIVKLEQLINLHMMEASFAPEFRTCEWHVIALGWF